jgi:hypothetical protein
MLLLLMGKRGHLTPSARKQRQMMQQQLLLVMVQTQ